MKLQVKICGLTSVDEALECVRFGANAVGCVFYSKSPRNVTETQARAICMALPPEVKSVGVFVNENFENIMEKVVRCNLKAVQLHGNETPELVSRLKKEKLTVIKALYIEGNPSIVEASKYEASACLVECSKGALPGGNAMTWNWKKARGFGNSYPFILAGGLNADNVCDAILSSLPDAVDVSSGVESVPGIKDMNKIKRFMDAVFKCPVHMEIRRIF